MRIMTLGFWALPFALTNAAAAGLRNRHQYLEKRKESVSSSSVVTEKADKFEGLRLSYITQIETTTMLMTDTQTMQVTVAADPVVVTVTETVAQPVTMTEVVTVAGEAVTTTITETVAGTCETPVSNTLSGTESAQFQNGAGVGVSTIPIAESALPTTTFASDPFATGQASSASTATSLSAGKDSSSSSSAASSAASSAVSSTASSTASSAASSVASSAVSSASSVVSSASSVISSAASAASSVAEVAASSLILSISTSSSTPSKQTMNSEIIMTQTTTAPVQSTVLATSVNLGGLDPESSAKLESVGQGSATAAASSSSGTQVNVSDLNLSSVLTLGNLVPNTAAIKARATHAA